MSETLREPWVVHEGVSCVECPECAFTFDADHENTTPQGGWSCPACAEIRLREALRELADEAARACTEPRRFHANEDQRQQALSRAVAKARALAAEEER